MRCIQCAHELSCEASRRGHRNEVQEAVQTENKEDHARQIASNYRSRFHNRFLLLDWRPSHGVNHLDVNTIDDVYFLEIQVFYDARLSRHGPRLARNDEGD